MSNYAVIFGILSYAYISYKFKMFFLYTVKLLKKKWIQFTRLNDESMIQGVSAYSK